MTRRQRQEVRSNQLRAPFRPVGSGTDIMNKLFPDARVTSGFRPKGTKLGGGQTHDRSWHTQSRAAVDIAPIPGMTFEQAAERIQSAGYGLIESRDEVNNPSKYATGPHWHFVIGKR